MALKKEKIVVNPVIDIKDVWIDISMGDGCNFLWGTPVNHPNESLNGTIVHTSFIVEVRGNVVETKRNVYNVLNWGAKIELQKELF